MSESWEKQLADDLIARGEKNLGVDRNTAMEGVAEDISKAIKSAEEEGSGGSSASAEIESLKKSIATETSAREKEDSDLHSLINANSIKISELEKDKPDLSDYVKKEEIADVATSGSYDDLSDTPEIPDISGIQAVIPSAATSTNQLADKAYVDYGVEQMAAKYLSADAQGNPFTSYSAFVAGPYYYAGAVATPTKNDYVLVNGDETHDGAVTRYYYTGSSWAFQYVVNNSPLNESQLAALNSGITSTKVGNYDKALSKGQITYCTCVTAAKTAAKVVSTGLDNFELTVGTVIAVKFTNTNSASNVTLNVDGTGAKSIFYSSAVYTSTSSNICGYASRVIYYVYDGTNWVWLNAGWSLDTNTYTSGYCVTTASTAAKVASCTYWVATAKSYLFINFRYANTVTSAITLNVNSTGAKPIYINGTASSTNNYTLPAGSYLAYYDGSNFYFRTDGKATVQTAGIDETDVSNWNSKQDAISDLSTIRSGASAGATAVQPSAISDMETQTHAGATYQRKGPYLTDDGIASGELLHKYARVKDSWTEIWSIEERTVDDEHLSESGVFNFNLYNNLKTFTLFNVTNDVSIVSINARAFPCEVQISFDSVRDGSSIKIDGSYNFNHPDFYKAGVVYSFMLFSNSVINFNGSSNDVISNRQIFVAKFGQTSYSEILDAYNVGKICVCVHDDQQYLLNWVDSDNHQIHFNGVNYHYWANRDNKYISERIATLVYDGSIATTTWSDGYTKIVCDGDNISGSARAVIDYGTPSQSIEIGWGGNSLTDANYIACYTDSSNGYTKAIKDMTIANVRKKINGTSIGGVYRPIYIDTNGAPQAGRIWIDWIQADKTINLSSLLNSTDYTYHAVNIATANKNITIKNDSTSSTLSYVYHKRPAFTTTSGTISAGGTKPFAINKNGGEIWIVRSSATKITIIIDLAS